MLVKGTVCQKYSLAWIKTECKPTNVYADLNKQKIYFREATS